DELEESIKNTDKALHGLSETNRKIIDLNSEEINQRYRQSRITQEMIDENEKLAIIINETEKATKEHTESVKDNNKEVESSTGVFQSLISALGQTKLGGALRNISGEFSGIKEQINGVIQTIGSSGGGGSGGGTATASGGGAAAGGGLVAALGWVAIAITAVVVAVKLLKAGFEKLISIMDRALSVSTEYENAVVNFASKTKAAQEEIVEFDRALRNAFKTQGFTDNVEYLGDVLTKVQMLLKLTGDEASQMAKDIVMVSEITGYSADEIIKTQQRIVANYRNYPEELQVDAAGALDVILSTYQQTLDINNDMLSTFTRYATEVNKMQLSMEYFYALLITGSKSGARSLTHVGDTIREIYSRVTEGSDKVLEAFDQLDISYANTVRAFNTGGREAELALNTIINAIVEVSDKAEQHNIIDSLMGRRGKTVGIEFFNAIAEAEEEINRFEGSVLDAHQRITSGLSYQTGQIKAEVQNFLTSLWDEVGSVLTPLIAEFYADVEEHMWVLEDVIQEKIVPAFENLASTIFVAFNLDQFNDAGELLSAIADIIVILIDGASRLIIAFRGIYHTVAIIFNLFQMLHEAFMTIIDTISLAIFHNNDNIVQNIAATFENILKLAGNLGIGIVNIFIGVFKSIYNHFVDKTLNKMLNAYNATIAKIPGIKEIQLMATYDEEEMFKTFDYLEMKPLKNDFKEKGFAATMSDFFEKQGKRFEKITKDWNDLQYHWDQLTTDDLQNRIDKT
ncbi:MAG: hypothetical protein GX957_04725, partial [Clostridiaceae bacterium]|nr:hypothetical protein [Clostridiaceae bacterium]